MSLGVLASRVCRERWLLLVQLTERGGVESATGRALVRWWGRLTDAQRAYWPVRALQRRRALSSMK